MSLRTPNDDRLRLYKCTHCGHRMTAIDPDECEQCGGPLVDVESIIH